MAMRETENADEMTAGGAMRSGGNGSKVGACGAELLVSVDGNANGERTGTKALRRAVVALFRATSAELPSPDRAFSTRSLEYPVDIVIPVFNAPLDVRLCIRSVLKHAPASCRIVIVDDASTDKSVTEFLKTTAGSEERIVLIRNEVNLGFVKTANRGMRHAEGRDVLLLNSDTVVTENFVERMQQCARQDDFTGIVTPLTNNGTICSAPLFCMDNPLPRGHTVDSFASLIAASSLRLHPAIPTAVGFCMYIRHEVFEDISYFDEKTFGRGYGEENDFCERAEAAGFVVRLCDDLFVFHKGGASFGEESSEISNEHQKILAKKHPQYHEKIGRFISKNPLLPIHDNVRLALNRSILASTPSLLLLIHTPLFSVQGGTEFHVRDVIKHLGWERVVIAYTAGDHLVAAEVINGKTESPIYYSVPLSRPVQRFEHRHDELERLIGSLVDAFNVELVHIHHLFNLPISIWRTFAEQRIPYVLTCHDYYCVCPSHNLIDSSTQRSCDHCFEESKSKTVCVTPLLRSVPVQGSVETFLEEHRREFAGAIEHAEYVVFPSAAAKEIVGRAYELRKKSAIVIEHGYDKRTRRIPKVSAGAGGMLRVAFIGAISNPIKGAENHLKLISILRNIESIEWHFFGDVEAGAYAQRLLSTGIEKRLFFHGAYERDTICGDLIDARIDLVVLLPTWPETFSFTLSEALCAGKPVIVADSGAPGERIRATRFGIAVDSVEQAASILIDFAKDRTELKVLQDAARVFSHKGVSENALEYRRLYESILERRKDDPRPLVEKIGARSLLRAFQHTKRRAETGRSGMDGASPLSPVRGAHFAVPGVLRYELADIVNDALKRRIPLLHGKLKSMFFRIVSVVQGRR
jgi:GT2 family glycosyltransferase/glycosyltransferase involved in cell wall biosynthesis